jgi:hypothetical protein
MKKWSLKVLKKIIDRLSVQYTKYLPKNRIDLPYNPLSPTDEAEKVEEYLNSLEWALQNRHKIKNIAIAGAYGSGKSSVIQTFQKKHKYNDDYTFLNISLATFKEDKEETEIPGVEKDDILRLIELSILQQLFYHEKDKNIPDSGFKKIKSHKDTYLWLLAFGLVVFTTSFLHLVFPSFLAKFSILNLTPNNSSFFHYTSVAIVFIGSLFMLFKSIRIIKGITIKKLGISNASIEIDNKISKSILNNHIDEILYFFEVTNNNVVIIEDLDRFEQTDVFTKLREINLLINRSKKIEKDVVFIYAIRDDMFQDKDRTKFFDFIIPIIPIINSSNSNEKLLKIIKSNKYEISEELTENLSLFIDDMRLLYNIMNEYHLYSKKLNQGLIQNNLLSMVVYKNIYPNDFTELSQSKGELYATLVNKHKYINELIFEIDNKITTIKNEIKSVELTNIKDIKELRIIYLYKIIEKINQNNINHPFYQFFLNNRVVSMSQAVEDDNFEVLINTRSLQYTYNNNQGYRQSYNLDFTSIENEINSELSYAERADLILTNNEIEVLKNQIEKLEDKKKEIKKYKIKDLISDKVIDIISQKQRQKELINVLLRNGYIDEDYLDYISIFYEGSLSKNDHQFLINVKTLNKNEFDYPLQKKENLIKKISEFEFEKEYILNYDLLDFLIKSTEYPHKRKRFLEQLGNESNNVISFIDGFIDYTENIGIFINSVCKNWINIWSFIENNSDFTKEKVDKYFKLIIEYADVSNIKIIFAKSKDIISDNEGFLTIIKDDAKLKKIINQLNIKFNNLNESPSNDLLDYIYNNDYYVLNIFNIRFILKLNDLLNVNDFNTKNYDTIKKSKLTNLINYIDSNINEYIEDIYLNIETNKDEIEEYYIELLNNEDILVKNKIKLINTIETLIIDINKIDDLEIIKHVLTKSKVLANWLNLIDIYIQNENQFIPEITSFINVTENSKCLSEIKIQTDKPDEATIKSFLVSLLKNNDIKDDNYSKILSSVPYIYNSLSFENISFEKVKSLIIKNKLTVNNTNYVLLNENFENLHILLIENNPNTFIKEIKTFEIENNDLLALLESEKISIQIKAKLIDNFEESIFVLDSGLLTQVGKLLLENNNLNIANNIIKAIGTDSNLDRMDKIRLFNKWNSIYDNEDTKTFLISLANPYSQITENGKRPLLENNEVNKELAENLKDKRYISKYKIESKLFSKGIRISTFRNE